MAISALKTEKEHDVLPQPAYLYTRETETHAIASCHKILTKSSYAHRAGARLRPVGHQHEASSRGHLYNSSGTIHSGEIKPFPQLWPVA